MSKDENAQKFAKMAVEVLSIITHACQDAETTVAARVADKKRYRATRDGKRKQRYAGPTMATHARAVKTEADNEKHQGRNRLRRLAYAQKAAGVATPKDCTPQGIGVDGVPLFRTQSELVPKGSDNRPLIAEKAAARAVQHRAEKGTKTRAEIEADRRARLPDNVRPSRAASRAGLFYIVYYVDKSYSKAIRSKFKKNFSVVKPGTNGFYPSKKAAAEVRDEWIKLKRPATWMAKEKR